MVKWWEEAVRMQGLSPEVAAERIRVLRLLDGNVDVRLMNLIANGVDLEEQLALPPEERASGFNWVTIYLAHQIILRHLTHHERPI